MGVDDIAALSFSCDHMVGVELQGPGWGRIGVTFTESATGIGRHIECHATFYFYLPRVTWGHNEKFSAQ